MKYFSIILTVMVTALIGRAEEPQTGWFFDQSTQQSFYLFDAISIDGLVVEGDGTGEGDGGCELLGTCDVVGAFRRGVCDDPGYQNSQQLCEIFSVWNMDEEICIGWRYADSNGATTVPLMGKEGDEGTNTFTYANGGESAYLKVYDSSNGSILDLSPSSELPGWVLNQIFTIDGTSTACNGGDELDECGICSGSFGEHEANSDKDCAGVCFGESVDTWCDGVCGVTGPIYDDCGVCDGGNADKDCAGVCFGESVDTWCDGVCGVTGPIDDLCGDCDGGNVACTGCTNSDADCFADNSCGCTNTDGDTADCSESDNSSCVFTVPPATNLAATPGPARVSLAWDAASDNFTESSAGYKYDIYMNGDSIKTTSQTSSQITGLEGLVVYCFTVQAIHNEYGPSADQSDEVCATPEEAGVDPIWRIQLKAEIDSYDQFQFSGNEDWLLHDDENFLGVASDGTYGYDAAHDAPDPPQGPGNYIKLFFDHPEWNEWVTHFTEDIVLEDDDFFSTNLTQWNVRVQSDVPGSTVIRFTVDIGIIPENYEMYVELNGNYTRLDHFEETAIEFYMDGSGQQDLAVYIGNIVPQAPDSLEIAAPDSTINNNNFNTLSLDWVADATSGDDYLNDIGNRYPATSYNVYRDDEPTDYNSNSGSPGNGPGGCGGSNTFNTLLTGASGQTNTDYFDNENLYPIYDSTDLDGGELLLQESTYSYTVTGNNDAGESSEGHTVRLSGGSDPACTGAGVYQDCAAGSYDGDTWNDGRGSTASATTGLNADPIALPVYMWSPNGTNVDIDGDSLWLDGVYEIPHNNHPDANRIVIEIGAWGTNDPDFPYADTLYFDYQWTKCAGTDTCVDPFNDLTDIEGLTTAQLSFQVANAHENAAGEHNVEKSYTWNLEAKGQHPIRVQADTTINNLTGVEYFSGCYGWTTSMHPHSNDKDIMVTIRPEPNNNPIAAAARDLPRFGDGASVVTSDQYDNIGGVGNDFNDYDDSENRAGAHFGVWYEPHDNNIGNEVANGIINYFAGNADFGNNNADLYFTADSSDDSDGMCTDDISTGCDQQTYEWFYTKGSAAAFNYLDLNANGIYDIGERFSLLDINSIVKEFSPEEFWDDDESGFWDADEEYVDDNTNGFYDVGTDLGSYLPPNQVQYVECDNCTPGQFTSEDDTENVGFYGHGAIDLHAEFQDNVYILTLKVTDVYNDVDTRSMLLVVKDERNSPPDANEHRSQPSALDDDLDSETYGDSIDGEAYYVNYGDSTKAVSIRDDAICSDDLGAVDTDNDDLTYVWTYSGNDSSIVNLSGFDSDYAHSNGATPGGWQDASADLRVGTHTFTFTVTDSYNATSSASTTFEIREEPTAAVPIVTVEDTDLKYTVISVKDSTLGNFASDDCYGEVYDGAHYNTQLIKLYNTTVDSVNSIKEWVDGDGVESTFAVHIDKNLEAETQYIYMAVAYNSNLLDAESASSTDTTTTHDRPQVEVLTPNGAEIRSIGDNFDVDFSTTQKQYISKIEVFYLPNGLTGDADYGELSEDECNLQGGYATWYAVSGSGGTAICGDGFDDGEVAGVNSSDAAVGSNTGTHVDGFSSSDTTVNFEISDNGGTEINYNAKVVVRVWDAGNYDGGNVEYHDDVSDYPFTMAAHLLTKDYAAGWHLLGPPLVPGNNDLVENFGGSLGNWGSEWVAYDVTGTYDGLSLNLGEGYYLALAGDKTLVQEGNPVIADPDCADCSDNDFALGDLNLIRGWNLVANPLVNKVSKYTFMINDGSGDDLDFEDAVDAGWIAPTIYGWFENSYVSIDRIMPFDGYWVNTSRDLIIKVRPHLFENGELTRKAEDLVTSVLELRARDISGEGISDFITIGLAENAVDEFVYGEDEYDLPRQAYASMGGEFIDMKVTSNLMKDMKSAEYDDYQAWTISIESEKVDNDIELSWGDVSGFEDDLHLIVNGEAINMHEENYIELTSMIEEVAIVVGNVDSYLNPIPEEFGLSAAYPNPFNPTTNLGLALNADGYVSMSVFNIRGQVVEVLVDRNMKAGYHNITWNADGISSGMYFVRVETGANTAMQKLMLLK